MKGDCLSCTRLGRCSQTNLQKVLKDHTCVMFEPVEQPVFMARVSSMELYGTVPAVRAMLDVPDELPDEVEDG